VILEEFGARYIISDLDHAAFMRRTDQDPAMREVYRDEYSVVYEIIGK
jgi:hypothetical protein